MKLTLPGMNAQVFAMGFVLRQTARKIHRILEQVGQENMKLLVSTNRPLKDLPQVRLKEAELRAASVKYRPLADKISDEQFLHMLPPWVLQIVQDNGETGVQWLQEQLVWLRQFFRGEV